MNDELYDSINDAYYSMFQREAGVEHGATPSPENIRWQLKNKQNQGEDDQVNRDILDVVEYFNSPVNVIENRYVARYLPYQYVAYSRDANGTDITLHEDITTHYFRLVLRSERDYDPIRDEEYIIRLFENKKFVQYVWPHNHYAFADSINGAPGPGLTYYVEDPESNVSGFNYDETETSLFSSLFVTYDLTPRYEEIPLSAFDRWTRYRWKNTYISYALDEAGTSRQWQEDREHLFFRNFTYKIERVATPTATPELLESITNYTQYLWPHMLTGYSADDHGLSSFSVTPITASYFYRRFERVITEDPEYPSNVEWYLTGDVFTQYIESSYYDYFILEDGTMVGDDTGSAFISGYEYSLRFKEDNEKFYIDAESSVIRERYTVPSAFAIDDAGNEFNIEERPYRLFYRSSIDTIDFIGQTASSQQFFTNHNAKWTKYIDRRDFPVFADTITGQLHDEEQSTSMFSGVLSSIYYIETDTLISSAYSLNQYRRPYQLTAYAANDAGLSTSQTEDQMNLFWRTTISFIDVLEPGDQYTATYFNSKGAIWEQYIASSVTIGYKASEYAAVMPEDVGASSQFSGIFTQTYYIGTRHEDDPWYVSGEPVTSWWDWDRIRQPYNLTAFGTSINGANASVNEDVFTKFYRIDIDLVDELDLTSATLISKHSNDWIQYVSSYQELRFKNSMEAVEYTTYETPSSMVSGLYHRLSYINNFHNNNEITSYINYEQYKWPFSKDPFAKFRIRYTSHSNDQYPNDFLFNQIPKIGTPAERPSVSDGVHEVVLTETSPSSNIWVALAKDNPSLPSSEVLSSFDEIPAYVSRHSTGHSYYESSELSTMLKPCKMVYEDGIKAFFTNVNKTNYSTFLRGIDDYYNSIIIKDGMLDRQNGLRELLLKTSSFNSFFSNSMMIAGVSGANVGMDGNFVMNPSTGDYDTGNCAVNSINNIKNDYEIVIGETESFNSRFPHEKFSHEDSFFSELSTLFNDVAFTCDEPNMYTGDKTFNEIFTPFSTISAMYNLSGAHIENAQKSYVIPAFRLAYNAVETNSITSGSYNSDYALADLDTLTYDNVGLHLNDFKRTVKRWSNDSYVVNNKFNLFVYQHPMDNGTFKDFITFNAKTEHYFYHLSGIIDAPDSNSYHIFGAALECYMRSDRTALELNNITSPTTGYIEPSNRPMFRIYQLNPYSNNVEEVMGEILHD